MNKVKANYRRCYRVGTAAAVTTGTLLAFGPQAFADTAAPLPADPTGGALNTVGNAGRTWISTYGIPAVIAVMAFMTLVGIGFAWVRKVRGNLKRA